MASHLKAIDIHPLMVRMVNDLSRKIENPPFQVLQNFKRQRGVAVLVHGSNLIRAAQADRVAVGGNRVPPVAFEPMGEFIIGVDY